MKLSQRHPEYVDHRRKGSGLLQPLKEWSVDLPPPMISRKGRGDRCPQGFGARFLFSFASHDPKFGEQENE